MTARPHVEELASYLPRRLVERLALRDGLPTGPAADHFEGAAFFADLSGFTPLAERLAQQGPRGAERLTGILDGIFGRMIARVSASGGDIVTFAGDAVLALWPADASRPLDAAARIAVRCALDCQRAVAEAPLTGDEGRLALRIGVGAGECSLHELGGWRGRWAAVAAGPALVRMGRAEKSAGPDQVVLADEVLPLVEGAFTLERVSRGWRVLEALANAPDDADGRVAAGPIPERLAPALRAYVPRAVTSRLDVDQGRWLAELRTVSAVFVQLHGLDPSDPAQGEALQRVVASAQERLDSWEGSLNKLISDDRGTTLVIGYGFPPYSHEDDALRAVKTAVGLRDICRHEELAFGIGVTTGRAFCGAYGSDRRREYTMLGDSVNLAARLMGLAANDVYCDAATVRETLERIAFLDLPPVSVRGKLEPVRVASPTGELDLTGRHEVLLTGRHETLKTGRFDTISLGAATGTMVGGELIDASSQGMDAISGDLDSVAVVGREGERALLEQRIRELDGLGRGGVIVLEAEAGYGKSLLGAWAHGRALALGVLPLLGASDSTTTADAWHAWRQVFAQLLGLQGVDEPTAARAQVEGRFDGQERLEAWIPLLGQVLPVAWPPNETTERMSGPAQAEALRELLAFLLRSESSSRPQLVLLEDVHWMDRSSWAFARSVAQSVDRVLLLLIARPMAAPPPQYGELLERADCDLLVLERLDDAQITLLACQRLQVDALDAGVASAITRRAEGNPYFAQELTWALVESGQIEVRDRRCVLRQGARGALELPDTLQGVVTSRLDRLDPRHGLTAKVAAVIGRSFGADVLREVHPQAEARPAIPVHLEALGAAEIAAPEGEALDADWSFRHIVVQETAYSLLPFAQRRELHAAVAGWFEAHPSDDAVSGPLLAWHWRRAEELELAIEALERTGEAAVRRGAEREALALLDEAIELEQQLASEGRGMSSVRRARWGELRGDALHQSGEMARSKATYAVALATLGHPVPGSSAAWAWFLARQLVAQVSRRLLAFLPRRALSDERAAALRSATSMFSKFGAAAYFTIEPLHWFAGSLAAVNLADRTGDDQPAGQALGAFGNVVGALRLQGAARHYFTRTRAIRDARDRTVGHWGEGVFELTYARWDAALATLDEGIALGRATADRYTLGVGLTARALVSFLTGRLEDAAGEHAEVLVSARDRGNVEHVSWSLCFGVPSLLALGRVAIVRDHLAEVESLVGRLDPFTHVSFHGVRAQLRAREGDLDGALADVVALLELYAAHPLALFTHLPGFGGAAEAVLAAVEADGRGAAMTVPAGWTLRTLTTKTLGLSRSAARSFLYFRPRALCQEGTWAALRGRRAAAARAFSAAEVLARKYAMHYEAALVAFERARVVASADPAKSGALKAARRAFEALGAAGDLARLDALVSGPQDGTVVTSQGV